MSAPRVSLEQWRVLQAVVDLGGFAQAAEYLHRSQSSVSYTIAKLQEQLGMSVLEIRGRKAVLTETGTALLRQSRHLLQDAMEIEQFATSLSQGWEAEIRLVVDAAFPTDMLMRALRQFEPLNRGTRVQLNEVVLSGAEDALLEGQADIAIASHVPPELLGDVLIEVDFLAVSRFDHPLQRLDRELVIPDLRHEMQVVIRDSGIRGPRDVGWLGAEHRWSVSSFETATSAVCEGLGYAWLPRHRIQALLDQGLLKPLELREGRIYSVKLFLVYGQSGNPGPGTRQLAEMLFAMAREVPSAPLDQVE
jgi:DNA-binding transcriptional LysR family regulator